MDLREALLIVVDIAEQNALDPRDCGVEAGLLAEAERQKAAIEAVQAYAWCMSTVPR